MANKIFFSLLVSLTFLFSVNFVLAQTCSDPTDPVSEVGQCRSVCDSATGHQISGTCMGQVCCVTNPSAGFPTDTAKTTTTVSAFDECIAQGGDYSDCKDRAGAPASTSASTSTATSGKCIGTCKAACGSGESAIAGPFTDCAQECCGSSGGTSAAPSSGFPAASTAGAATSTAGGWSLGNISGFGLPAGSVFRIITNILVWLLGLFGIIGILGFLISGIIYLTAAGDEDRMGYAKRAMQYSIIGVIVGLVGFVIIQAIDYALNTYSSF